MWRVMQMSGTYYAYQFEALTYEVENIADFVEQGSIVHLTDDLNYLCGMMNIRRNAVVIVE